MMNLMQQPQQGQGEGKADEPKLHCGARTCVGFCVQRQTSREALKSFWMKIHPREAWASSTIIIIVITINRNILLMKKHAAETLETKEPKIVLKTK